MFKKNFLLKAQTLRKNWVQEVDAIYFYNRRKKPKNSY